MNTFHQMMHDIRSLEFSMGKKEMFRHESVSAAKEKLERSLALNVDLNVGDTIKQEHLHMISPGNGYKWQDRNDFVGKMVNRNVLKNTLLTDGLFY